MKVESESETTGQQNKHNILKLTTVNWFRGAPSLREQHHSGLIRPPKKIWQWLCMQL